MADHNAVTSSGASLVVVVGFTAALGAVRVATARTATVELDPGTGAGDTVAFAGTAG